MLLAARGKIEDAVARFKEAIACKPDYAEAYNNLGYFLYKELDRPDEGTAYLRRAINLKPGLLDAHCNLGMVLQHQGMLEEALARFNEVLAFDPGLDEARLNRAILWLSIGDFERGWPEYEVRRKVGKHFIPRHFPYPEWDGSSLQGRTILVYAEQGLWDEIMFASCLPDVIRQAGHCVIECSGKVEKLFRRSFPAATVHGGTQTDTDVSWLSALPVVDCQVTAGSLPRYLRRSWADFPRHPGYLQADPERVAYWGSRLDELGEGPKIGISWRGGTRDTRQRARSFNLDQWSKMLGLPSVHFISLQYTDCREELARLKEQHGLTVHHWQEAIDDYDETAALVSALDLVVSVCTAVIHLGGALGRPVWVLAPTSPEWRYLREGDSMPWYPSVKLFRQSEPHSWREVFRRVEAALHARFAGLKR